MIPNIQAARSTRRAETVLVSYAKEQSWDADFGDGAGESVLGVLNLDVANQRPATALGAA